MDWDRVIYNGTVVNDDGMQRADIYIRDGRVAAVTSERLPGTVGETTDANVHEAALQRYGKED